MVGTVPKSGIQDKNNVQTQLNYGPAGFWSGFDYINSDYHVDTELFYDDIDANVTPTLVIGSQSVTWGLNDGISDLTDYANEVLGLNSLTFSDIFSYA